MISNKPRPCKRNQARLAIHAVFPDPAEKWSNISVYNTPKHFIEPRTSIYVKKLPKSKEQKTLFLSINVVINNSNDTIYIIKFLLNNMTTDIQSKTLFVQIR